MSNLSNNGIEDYNLKYEKKLEKVLKKHPELRGFASFAKAKAISTAYSYVKYVAAFREYNSKDVTELDFDDFNDYMDHIKKTKDGKLTTSSYQIAVYSALKKYGKYLHGARKLSYNPMEFMERPKAVESKETKQKREIGYLTEIEIRRLLLQVKRGVGSHRSRAYQEKWRERDMAIIVLFLNTGIRCSALMKIDRSDIDFKNKSMAVTDKEDKVNTFVLSDYVVSVLEEWDIKRKMLLGEKEEKAFFISNQLHRMDQSTIAKLVNKYAENIYGKHITPHKLRATYGTQLYNETKDIYFVQKCMVHSSPTTTEGYIRGEDRNAESKKAALIMTSLTGFDRVEKKQKKLGSMGCKEKKPWKKNGGKR